MKTVPDPSAGVIGGIDTHRDVHVAAAIDHLGRDLGVESFPATEAGEDALLAWFQAFGPVLAVGCEGTSSYGKNLNRIVTRAGVTLIEVQGTNRQARRRNGKSDPADAMAAARAVLSGEATTVPKATDGTADAVRAVRTARKSAMKARTQAGNELLALVRCGPGPQRDAFAGDNAAQVARVVAGWDLVGDDDVRHAMVTLATRWLTLDAETVELDKRLGFILEASADVPTQLLESIGVGNDVASAIVVAIGDNADRVVSDAAFAALAGVSPVDASSGLQQRHRLNRGGNRDLNNALWRIVIVRLGVHQPTKDYMARRLAEHKTKREVIRCLKRYVAREIFHIYKAHHATPQAASDLQHAA